MQCLADAGMLIISTSIRSQLLVFSSIMLGSYVSQVNENYTVLLKKSLSFEYNFKKIFKGTNLKPQIIAQH